MKRARRAKGQPFLEGDKVVLRPLRASDLAGPYLDWLNDYEVTRFLETGRKPATRESLRRYLETVAQAPDTVMLAIVEKTTGVHVGNVKLAGIHTLHRRADMGIMLGDKQRWGRGYGREAVALILEYGFDRLNLNKIYLGVDVDNAAAVKVYEQLGFKIEGTQRQHLFRDGAYRDRHLMGILREEYRGRAS
jgi:ribosomal-protein-alanine N-acetyltransferase